MRPLVGLKIFTRLHDVSQSFASRGTVLFVSSSYPERTKFAREDHFAPLDSRLILPTRGFTRLFQLFGPHSVHSERRKVERIHKNEGEFSRSRSTHFLSLFPVLATQTTEPRDNRNDHRQHPRVVYVSAATRFALLASVVTILVVASMVASVVVMIVCGGLGHPVSSTRRQTV